MKLDNVVQRCKNLTRTCFETWGKLGENEMKQTRKFLRKAVIAHSQRHPGHKPWAGMNFVCCETCGKHAHIQGAALLIHNADYSETELIAPEQF